MAVECHIVGNVRGVGCVPSRRSDRCTWSAVDVPSFLPSFPWPPCCLETGREHGARCDRREGECT
eukprot:3473318-Prymnesium_polylepis.1